uniref:Chemokine (C-C motif) receptor 7 n=1 Tax=Neogobius melanostomus TaxID=47308 RepID=A0A8C6SM67_9GOBI
MPPLLTTPTDNYDNYNDNFTVDLSDFPVLCSKEDNRNFRQWFMPTFYSIICFLGFTGNLLVILTYFYFHRLAVCKIMHTIYKVTFYSSMFLLSSISVDRYFAISKAVSAHKHRARAVFFSKISSAIMWVLALIFSIPEMTFTTINNNTCTPYKSNNDTLRVNLQTGQIILAFLIPLLIMSFCYIRIILTLSQTRGFERNRAIKVILAVVAVFLCCQLPYNIVLFWTTVVTATGGTTECDNENSQFYATDITQCIAFFRCCLNPVVYAFIGVKFRHDVLKLLKELGCLSQERFFKYTFAKRKTSMPTETETTTTFSP